MVEKKIKPSVEVDPKTIMSPEEAFEMGQKMLNKEGKVPGTWKEAKKALRHNERTAKTRNIADIGNIATEEELSKSAEATSVPVVRREESVSNKVADAPDIEPASERKGNVLFSGDYVEAARKMAGVTETASQETAPEEKVFQPAAEGAVKGAEAAPVREPEPAPVLEPAPEVAATADRAEPHVVAEAAKSAGSPNAEIDPEEIIGKDNFDILTSEEPETAAPKGAPKKTYYTSFVPAENAFKNPIEEPTAASEELVNKSRDENIATYTNIVGELEGQRNKFSDRVEAINKELQSVKEQIKVAKESGNQEELKKLNKHKESLYVDSSFSKDKITELGTRIYNRKVFLDSLKAEKKAAEERISGKGSAETPHGEPAPREELPPLGMHSEVGPDGVTRFVPDDIEFELPPEEPAAPPVVSGSEVPKDATAAGEGERDLTIDIPKSAPEDTIGTPEFSRKIKLESLNSMIERTKKLEELQEKFDKKEIDYGTLSREVEKIDMVLVMFGNPEDKHLNELIPDRIKFFKELIEKEKKELTDMGVVFPEEPPAVPTGDSGGGPENPTESQTIPRIDVPESPVAPVSPEQGPVPPTPPGGPSGGGPENPPTPSGGGENGGEGAGGEIPPPPGTPEVPAIEVSAEAARILEIVTRQERERLVQERINERIRGIRRNAETGEIIEDGEARSRLGRGMFGTMLRSISLRTQNLFNFGEARRIREEINSRENILEEREREYITEVFRDIAEGDPFYETNQEERARFQQIMDNKGLTSRIINHPTAKRILDHPIIGNLTVGVLILGGSSLIAKSAIRMGAKMAYGAGGVGGALAGGALGGFVEYRKAQEAEFDARRWSEELANFDVTTPGGRADLESFMVTLERTIDTNRNIKGNEASALALMYAMRERRIEIRSQEERAEAPASIAEAVADALDARDEVDNENPILEGRGIEIFAEIMQNKNREIRRRAARGAMIGATIGGVAGAVGEYMHHAHAVADQHAPELAGKSSMVRGAVGFENAARHSVEVSFPHDPAAMRSLLDHENFVAMANSGDGTEVTMGRALHDYIVNFNKLGGGDINLTKEQFMAVRALMSHQINPDNMGISQPGELFTMNGNDIHAMIANVQHMNPNQLDYFRTHVSAEQWSAFDPARHQEVFGGETNNFADRFLAVKSNADLHTILAHNNPEMKGDLYDMNQHIAGAHEAGAADVVPSPDHAAAAGGADVVPSPEGAAGAEAVSQVPGVGVEHAYTPDEVATNNNLPLEQQRAYELSAIEDTRIPEGAIKNMRQLMLNLENSHENGVIARDPLLYQFAKDNGIADINAGALKHAGSQADINAIVDKVSKAARPYLTEDFIKTWRAKWIK